MKTIKTFVTFLFSYFMIISCNSEKEINTVDDYFSICVNDVRINRDSTRLFYGITADRGTFHMKDIPLPISIKNNTNKEINPFVLFIDVLSYEPVSISRYYRVMEKSISNNDSIAQYLYKLYLDDKILFPYESIPSPITDIHVGKTANIIFITYFYGTNVKNFKYNTTELIVYPISGEVREEALAFYEHDFLKAVRGHMNWNDPENTSLVFNSKFIPRLINYKLLEPVDFKIHRFDDLISE